MAIKETDNFVKSSFGWLEMVNYSSAPTDVDTSRRGLAFVGGSLKYYNGSTFVAVGGSGGASTWDEIYDNDKTLSIDDGAFVIQLLAGESTNALTLSAQATATGAVLGFSNSGTGNDITGTSSTWGVTKAGAATFDASVTTAAIVGSTNLTIDATGTGTITLAGTSTGAIVLTTAVTATASITITGTADSNCLTVTAGDVLISNGKIALTNDDTDAALTMTANSVTTGNVILVTANGVTSGTMVNLVTTASGFSGGYFIACNDGSVRFGVGVDGATSIVTGVNSTKALEITGIQTSENMITLTSSGVTADNKAVLLINSSGNSASGSNQIRIAPSGTPVDGSIGIEFVGASKLMQAMYIDCDSVDNSCVVINGGGALASGKSVLNVTADGTPASGAIGISFDISGATMTNNPIAFQVKSGASTGAAINVISTATTITGGIVNITNNAMTTGKGFNFAHTTSVIAGGGTLCNLSSTSIDTTTTSGALLTLTSTASVAATQVLGTFSALTTGIGVSLVAAALTEGSVLKLGVTEATITTGFYLQCNDGAADDFTIGKYGAVVIAGNASTDILTVTAGNAVLTAGNLTLTLGNAVLTAGDLTLTLGNAVLTNGNLTLSEGKIALTDTADERAFSVTGNVTAASQAVALFKQDHATGAVAPLELSQDDDDIAILKVTATAGSGKTVDSDDKSGGTGVYIKIDIGGTPYWIKATPGA